MPFSKLLEMLAECGMLALDAQALGHISAISRRYLGDISAISRRYLGHISATSRRYLAQEHESGNTAMHIVAFGGCIELMQQLAQMGASVGLPNRDGFTPLDSSQPTFQAAYLRPARTRTHTPTATGLAGFFLLTSSYYLCIPSCAQAASLQELLLAQISKPPSWTPDRMVRG